jgi:hypothetical protein
MVKVSPVTGKAGYPGMGWIITTEYIDDNYFRLFNAWHTGHDLARSRQGGEPVYAVADGVVKWAEFAGNNGFGNLITIQHAPDLYSRYGHLAQINVQRGQNVTAGTVIGILGSTGRSTAPHLHFDVMRKNNALDWPGLNKARLLMEYINPHDWYRDTVTIDPGKIEPPDFLRIIAPNGLNVRAAPSVTGAIINKLPIRTIIEVKRGPRLNADGYFWRELTSGGWIAEAFTELLTKDNNPIIIIPPAPVDTPIIPPVNVALRGVHASAGGWSPKEPELRLVRALGIQSVLIVAYQPGQADQAISGFKNAGVKDFIIRAATPDKAKINHNPQDFISDTLPRLQEYQRALGSTPFILAIHNEPNAKVEGWGSAWQNGAEFAAWYLKVAEAYRQAFPGVKIGFPALSPGEFVPDIRMDEKEFAAGCVDAIAASDWVGVHAYFANDGNSVDLKPAWWREMAKGRSIIITEGGPADIAQNTWANVGAVYRRCGAENLPCMAWLLDGSGAWQRAEWLRLGDPPAQV